VPDFSPANVRQRAQIPQINFPRQSQTPPLLPRNLHHHRLTLPLPPLGQPRPNPSANLSGVNRKLASTRPSPTGKVSSKSALFVKFRMQKNPATPADNPASPREWSPPHEISARTYPYFAPISSMRTATCEPMRINAKYVNLMRCASAYSSHALCSCHSQSG